jgi:hypothetical protein
MCFISRDKTKYIAEEGIICKKRVEKFHRLNVKVYGQNLHIHLVANTH